MNSLLLVWVILTQAEHFRFSAGNMEILRQDNETVSHLYNGVEVFYGTTHILANEGYYNEEDSTGYLVGDVRVSMETGTARAETLWFNGLTGEMKFSTDVNWVDTTKTISCDYARYRDDTVNAWGNIIVKLVKNRMTITGDTGTFLGQTQAGRIWGESGLVVYDDDTVDIHADTFFIYEDTIWGKGGVSLKSSIGRGTAGKIKLFENRLLLIDSSMASWENGTIKADTIVIHNEDDTLTILKAKSNSFLLSEEDSSSLSVQAYEISMNFVRDSLESIIGNRVIEGIYNERRKREPDTEGN